MKVVQHFLHFPKNRINNPTNKAQHRKINNHKGEKRFKSYKIRTAPKQHTTHFWITLISLILGFSLPVNIM